MSYSSYTHGSGDDLFIGIPTVIESSQDYIDNFDVSEAIEDALMAARVEIQEMALRDPEWAPYADLLDIEFVDGEFHYILTGEQERIDQALQIEYGGDGRSPNSILRKLALQQPAAIGVAISKMLNQEGPLA